MRKSSTEANRCAVSCIICSTAYRVYFITRARLYNQQCNPPQNLQSLGVQEHCCAEQCCEQVVCDELSAVYLCMRVHRVRTLKYTLVLLDNAVY